MLEQAMPIGALGGQSRGVGQTSGQGAWAAIAIDPQRAHFFDARIGANAVAICRNAASDARLLMPRGARRPCRKCVVQLAAKFLAGGPVL